MGGHRGTVRLPTPGTPPVFPAGRITPGRTGGTPEQYELWANDGRVDASKGRTLDVGSLSEGCVVDDTTGSRYVGEEPSCDPTFVRLDQVVASPSSG